MYVYIYIYVCMYMVPPPETYLQAPLYTCMLPHVYINAHTHTRTHGLVFTNIAERGIVCRILSSIIQYSPVCILN